jgi:hypothetical protein
MRKNDQIFVALQGFAGELHGVPLVFTKGTRLRSDHPAVRKWPHNWVPDGTPDDEIRRILAEQYDEALAEARDTG